MSQVLVSGDAVVTVDGRIGDAVLVDGGIVVGVGDRDHLARPGMPEQRYRGTIVPGLVDAHLHPVGLAAARAGVDLHDAGDLAGVVAALAEAMGDGVVVGTRLDEHRLTEDRLPTRTDLDAVPGPVLVHRVCGHVAVANTAALDAAGIGPQTVDPPGGALDRSPHGVPTGVLREEAIPLVAAALPPPSHMDEHLLATLGDLRRQGLTRLGAIVAPADGPFCGGGNELATVLAVADRLPLPLHVYVATNDPTTLERAARDLEAAGSDRLRFAGVKLFADGSYGGGTAAMRTGEGILRLVPERDRRLARTALDLGGGLALHAIGDAAIDAALDLLDDLTDDGADPARLRLEHASTTPDDLVDRIAASGIGVAIQPAFVGSERSWLGEALGPRAADAHRFGSLHRAGARLGGSSDSPVEPPSPLWGMRWARNRGGFLPDEAVDAATALGWWTAGAHDLLVLPPPLAPGSPADLTVLGADPLVVPAADLPDVPVVAVWQDGVPAA
ncbi:MAG: amidohydrolase family protein [Acidimicrobiia bacterium]